MKKRILSLILCGGLFVGLTGCGTTENNDNSQNNINNQNVENQEKIAVTNVYATSDEYAIVAVDEVIYIIDMNGKKQGTIDFEINDDATISINNSGYIYYTASYDTSKILDKSGKVIYEKNNNEKYNYITENNYTLRTSTKSDFENGNTSVTEIIDMSGNVIKEVEDQTSYYYLGGNIWCGYSSNESDSYFLYNEKTENKVNIENSTYQSIKNSISELNVGTTLKDGGVILGSQYITADLKIMEADLTYVSNEYYYNKEDYSIYKYDGTKVKEFTSGNGFSHIYSTDDKYYVKSGTGYFYTLDEKLEQAEQPYKLDEIKGTTKRIGNNCILINESVKFAEKGYEGTWNHFYLYDYKGQLIEDLGEGWNGITEINHNIIQLNRMSSTEYNERTGNRDKTYLGPQTSNKYINLKTGTVLEIY